MSRPCPMGVLQPSQIDTWWVWERHNEQAMSHGCVAVLTARHLVGMGEAGSHNTANLCFQTDSGGAQA